MHIFDFIICVVFDNMFKIFKDPDENKQFLGLFLGYPWHLCLFVCYPSIFA